MPLRPREALRALLPIAGLAAVAGFAVSLLSGDGCGPVERGVRAALGTWDMWETPLVAPHQRPLHAVPAGTVPVGGRPQNLARARAAVAAMPAAEREQRAALVYRRACHHCHGENGDNRIIVGESFPFRLPDLRSDAVQGLTDSQIFDSLTRGSERMIPLAATLSARDRLLAISYLRSLKGRPSRPFFRPRWVDPAEQPGGPRR